MPNPLVGLVVIVAVAVAMFLAASPRLPWSDAYELRAVFAHTQAMTPGTPVRIAGIEVGEVREIEQSGDGPATVTMEIADEGLPIRADATLKLRPRLFLEGNYFVDLRPGSPSAPTAEEGHTIPLGQTAGPVQIDQVLTSLPADVRAHLKTLLDELGRGLRRGGATGLRNLYRASPGAFRSTAVVNEALLGTQPHDLSGGIRNVGDVVAALARNEATLQGLILNLEAVTGALAREAEALERSIATLPGTIDAAQPALAALNDSLPAARAFAIEALPGVRALTPAVDAATPLLAEVRGLVSQRELRGLARDLRPATVELTRLERSTLPVLDELRALSSCFNEIVIPWANNTVPDPETPATGRIFEETSYGLVGISGESRSADSNGPYARVLGGSGTNLVVLPPFDGTTDEVFGVSPLPILGARPALDSSAATPFRPDAPCERQEPADLDSGAAAPPPEQMSLGAPPGSIEVTSALRDELRVAARGLERAQRLTAGTVGDETARRITALTDDALAALDTTLARALGWQPLLDADREWERRRAAALGPGDVR